MQRDLLSSEEQAGMAELASELRERVAQLDDVPAGTPPSVVRQIRKDLEMASDELRSRLGRLDPITQPLAFFDPADPRLFGTIAAVALLGQDRIPLADLGKRRFYGSGVYAIYYTGTFDLYEPISRKETPIYVGKADPATRAARTPQQQGTKLSARLEEHRKNVERANNIDVQDFHCRFLSIATGWQGAAESALIALFNPLWNKETKVLLGFGKHGDSAETRKNKRSPWDVLHQGRRWAVAESIEDAKSPERIESDVKAHFQRHPPIETVQEVLHTLLAQVGVG
jgi:hypothetical protein